MDKKKGLGRGLESLFGLYEEESNENITNKNTAKPAQKSENNDVTELDINKMIKRKE